MSFQHILAPLESLDVGVLDHAIQAALRNQAKLTLLHCINAPIEPVDPVAVAPAAGFPLGTSALNPQVTEQVWDARQEQAQSWLAEYCERAIAQGISATYEAKLGEPGSLICELVRDWQIDLIIMGRKGHSGLTELLLGSVSNHVLHHAPCSVLVIQGNE